MNAPTETQELQTLRITLLGLARALADPSTPDRDAVQQQLEDVLQRTGTTTLLHVLTPMIGSERVPEAGRLEFKNQCARLAMRPDGVRAVLEFVFFVQATYGDGAAGAAQPQTEGAQITPNGLKMAMHLLANSPQGVTAEHWYPGIAPQLLALLDGHDGLDLAKAAAYIIGFGILGRQSTGARGTPGWNSFAEPMLRAIDPISTSADDYKIFDLPRSAAKVVVSDMTLAQGLRRLQTLIISHPHPALTRRLLGTLVLPLWSLSSWPNATKRCEEDYCLPARNLLKIYLKISTNPDKIMPIVRDLLFEGRTHTSLPWVYRPKDATRNSICIMSSPGIPLHPSVVLQTRWNEIGPKSDALVDLLLSISPGDMDDGISSLFMDLFGRGIGSRKPKKPTVVLVNEEDVFDDDQDPDSNPLAEVFDKIFLQKMIQRCSERVAGNPNHMFALVEGLLRRVDSDAIAEDDTLPECLSMLNLIVTSPGFRRAKADPTAVQSIKESLEKIGQATGSDAVDEVAKTAKNMLLLLRHRDELEDQGAQDANAPTVKSKQQVEDRKTYNLAMSYIMQADSPPPVRSEGIALLQGLVQSNSPVLDIPAMLVLMSSLLDENEDYVNLRVIKVFALLANRHPKSTTKELLDHYVDTAETKSVDARLRFGEALLQVVQRLGATFAGDTAQQVGQALLETAGRRGHRAKTAAKQARAARMQEMKNKKKAASGDAADDDNDIDLDDALLSDDEKQRNEILSRIVDGWGSKRGSEDVRIRASALSILGTCIEVNIGGLGAPLASGAVDVCMHILTMETELEKGILRRAAIILILSFVRALHEARETQRRLGFGLTQQSQDEMLRILRYVAGTDEDGLVKQHAIDVIESLENWQLASLIPRESSATGPSGGLPKLAGLSINPANIGTSSASPASETLNGRPRIEEVD